jgi:hypothetical protein
MSVALQERRVVAELGNRHMIDAQLWERLVGRIVEDENLERSMSERIMDQTLGYLRLCAETTESWSPSALVDIGWHTFILYTREYAAFCERVAGRFMHHSPLDGGDNPMSETLERVVSAMRVHGISVDEGLWVSTKPQKCCSGGGSGN